MSLSFRGGVHPDGKKGASRKKPIEYLKPPAVVTIPMAMHIGAPCAPTVRVGSLVKLGQVIGESSLPVSAPIHASVSGKVTAVEPRLHPNGDKVMSVVIENDFKDEPDPSIAPRGSVESLSNEELLAAIKDAGIVGLGGAAFPTHLKISSGLGKVDTLLINAAECEPYITSNHRALLEKPEEMIGGIRVLMKLFGLSRAYIGIEANKYDAVKVLKHALPQKQSDIVIKVLRTKYPQGGEKQLIYAVTKREVPPGQLPASVGCAVFNVDTCAAIHRAITTGMPLIQRTVTVTGSAVANPKNLTCRIGTPFSDLVEGAGGYREEPYKVIMGGPMMGTALQGLDAPVIKATNALLSFSRDEDRVEKDPVCIRCGRCVGVCPMRLMPLYMYMHYGNENFPELEKLNLTDCIECGSCSFICPGRLHLAQSFKVAKVRLAEFKRKGDKA
ncbi:electron transport complex subunit RsxC [Oscillospiraceae bacterium OttesenSCG-928-F05]|nr:electron transport complex subunit RsxC [Oscillospiraceae bacterium OttesenSCG-928-F05]